MTEDDRMKVAELLQNGTAMSRLSHGEIVAALSFLESVGYEVTKKPVFEEQAFSMQELAENAALEGEDHTG